jgi:F-type H+-transporting ATPase subunit delta
MTAGPMNVNAYATAMWTIARADGTQDDVADELFRLARAVEGNDELRSTLTDQRIEVSRRQQILEDLLAGKATSTTVGLVSMLVANGRIGDRIVEMGAHTNQREVALVRSAVALSDDQKTRLQAALAKATGRDLDVKVVVDPTVVGGVVTQIGDTVLDGSVRSRLLQLREAF